MNVIVAGGSGFVGTALVRELTARGHDVTVLARSPEDADLPVGVDAVALDLTGADADAVESALAGQDAVVNLVALSPLFQPSGGNEMHERVHLDGTRKLVAAAEAVDVDRFVQMSALGADPDGDTHYIRAKGRAEDVVRDSALDWTVVRPSVVFGDGGEFVGFTKLLTTPYVAGLPGGGRTRFQPIWIGDLAPMLADCVDGEGHAGQTYELGGPEVLTLADVARQVYAAEGKSLRVVPIPMPLAKVGLTVGGAIPGFPMGPDQYRSLQFDNTVAGGDPEANDVRAFGVDPAALRTLRAYLAGEEEAAAGESAGGGGARELADGGAAGDSTGGDAAGDSSGDDAAGDSTSGGATASLLVGAETLGLFAFLSLAWFLPEFVDIYSIPGLVFLYIPSYLVTLVAYDGLLEGVVYAAEGVVGESPYAWDAGLLVTYYLFSVAAVGLGRLLQRRFGPTPPDRTPTTTR